MLCKTNNIQCCLSCKHVFQAKKNKIFVFSCSQCHTWTQLVLYISWLMLIICNAFFGKKRDVFGFFKKASKPLFSLTASVSILVLNAVNLVLCYLYVRHCDALILKDKFLVCTNFPVNKLFRKACNGNSVSEE